ncbi:Vegetative incompatibility protein HET-E-1 [Fusarium oxysporum f. sp. cubense]|nr:Vegetative incompatibility protein HET-E-1 [Fusarium oxysporum f. sp. cubense]
MAEALGVVSSVIAVVDLSAKVLSLCLQYSRDVKNAKDDIERLRREVADFGAITKRVQHLVERRRGQDLEASRQLDSAIKDGHSRLEELAQKLKPSKRKKAMSRLGIRALRWPFEGKDIEGTIQHLARCRGNILFALNLDQISILQNVDHRTALNQLPIADGASFDSHGEEHNPTCLQNTRVELLKNINNWIDDPNSKPIYWLNGMAGTGKSTISRTIAQMRHDRRDLGASFFFKRGEIDRGNLAKFVPTLARQLAWSMSGVALFVKKAIDADPDIVGKAVREQFEKLIREPLSKAAAMPSTPFSVVMIIDALDECEREADVRSLVNILSQTQIHRPRLKVLLTSRPELPVRLGFGEIQGTYKYFVLHEIPVQTVEHDISAFLAHEFRKIRDSFNMTVGDERKLPSDWPGQQTLQDLTQMAVPLFIFAMTICRFISDRRWNPQTRLQKVLDQGNKSQGSQLDQTYGPILRSQITEVSQADREEIIKDFREIVGSIVTLASPLSVTALSRLLDVSPDVVDERLEVLHSVLSIPLKRTLPVRLLHLSFRDYLVTEKSDFWVDERLTHRNLAKHCLRLMRGALRENICGLSFPGMRRSVVAGARLEEGIPPQLQYACMYWVHHQTKVDFKPNDSHEVYDFLKIHFLHWVEALSMMGRAGESLDSIRSLIDWLEASHFHSLKFGPPLSFVRTEAIRAYSGFWLMPFDSFRGISL